MKLAADFIALPEFRKRYHHYRKFLRFLSPYRWQVLISLVCTACVALLSAVTPLLAKVTIDVAFADRNVSLFLMITGVGLGILLVTIFFQFLEGYLNARVDQLLHFDLSRHFYSHLLSMPVGFVENRPVGDIIYRSSTDVHNVSTMILSTFPNFLLSTLKLILSLTITLCIHFKLALLALASFPILLINTVIFSEKIKQYQTHAQTAGSQLVSTVHDDANGFKLIKGFGKAGQQRRHYVGVLSDAIRLTFTTNIYKLFSGGVGGLLGALWGILLSVYAGFLVIGGELTVGELVAIGLYLGYLQDPIRRYAGIYQSIVIGSVSAERLEEYLQVPPESKILQGVSAARSPDEKLTPLQGRVEFKGVCFSYVPSQPVLSDCNFEVRAGANIALVGPSGVGKTTITKLLARFYDPQQGQILIDGRDLRSFPLEKYRGQLGLVTQEPILFTGTVESNIRFGYTDGIGSERFDEVVRRLGIGGIFEAFPQGLDTEVGPGGQFLSGGQRQIVAIGRALIRDPAILILDEAVSFLDIATEEYIVRMFNRLRQGRTTFVIAHKLKTIKECDCVFVLQGGGVVQVGEHRTLIRQPGLYRDMYRAQFRDWAEISPKM